MTTLAMLTTIIVALITAVIGPLLMTWFKNKLETKPKISSVKEAIDLNELVDNQLDVMMDELGCIGFGLDNFITEVIFTPQANQSKNFQYFTRNYLLILQQYNIFSNKYQFHCFQNHYLNYIKMVN